MNPGKRVVAASLLAALLAFAALFALALARFSANLVIPSQAFRWELAEALLGLIRWLPALQFLALAAAIGSSSGGAERLLGKSILPAAVLAVLLSAAALVAGPSLEAGRSGALAVSARFGRALDAARTALANGDPARAREAYTVLEAIDRKDLRVEELLEELRGAELKAERAAKAAAEAAEPKSAPAPAKKDSGGGRENYLKALDFYAKGDFFSAHWYASQAAFLDPSIAEARRLAAKSWEALSARGGGAEDEKRTVFFARKLDAYGLLRARDFVAAYREFSKLEKEAPKDPDVLRYLAESREELEKSAFFKEEGDKAAARRAYARFFAVLPSSDGVTRILAAREASFAPVAAYFSEFEYLESPGPGGAELRLRSPYAKLTEGRVLLVAVEREAPERVYRPALGGEAETASADGTKAEGRAAGGAKAPTWIELPFEPEAAFRIAAAREAPAALPALDAIQAAGEAERYGLDPAPLYLELQKRLGLPFAILTASTLGALIGLRFRYRGKKLPASSWLALPLMAATSAAGYLLVERVDLSIAALSVRLAPGAASLGVSAGIRAAFLLGAVLLAAGLREERELGGMGLGASQGLGESAAFGDDGEEL